MGENMCPVTLWHMSARVAESPVGEAGAYCRASATRVKTVCTTKPAPGERSKFAAPIHPSKFVVQLDGNRLRLGVPKIGDRSQRKATTYSRC